MNYATPSPPHLIPVIRTDVNFCFFKTPNFSVERGKRSTKSATTLDVTSSTTDKKVYRNGQQNFTRKYHSFCPATTRREKRREGRHLLHNVRATSAPVILFPTSWILQNPHLFGSIGILPHQVHGPYRRHSSGSRT